MVGLGIVIDLDKAKTTGFTAETIAHNADAVYRNASLGKEAFQVGLGGRIGKVSYEKSHYTLLTDNFGLAGITTAEWPEEKLERTGR